MKNFNESTFNSLIAQLEDYEKVICETECEEDIKRYDVWVMIRLLERATHLCYRGDLKEVIDDMFVSDFCWHCDRECHSCYRYHKGVCCFKEEPEEYFERMRKSEPGFDFVTPESEILRDFVGQVKDYKTLYIGNLISVLKIVYECSYGHEYSRMESSRFNNPVVFSIEEYDSLLSILSDLKRYSKKMGIKLTMRDCKYLLSVYKMPEYNGDLQSVIKDYVEGVIKDKVMSTPETLILDCMWNHMNEWYDVSLFHFLKMISSWRKVICK